MNRKYYWIGVILLMLLWFGPRILRKPSIPPGIELRFKASPTKMSMIKDLTSAYVVLGELPPVAEEFGLTEQALLTYLEQQFRHHGVKIISKKQYVRALRSGKRPRLVKVYPSIYEENGTVIIEIERIQVTMISVYDPRK